MLTFFLFPHLIVYSTIEVMYLSLRRSQHALLALSFFVVMILTVFSTLLYVVAMSLPRILLKTVSDTLQNAGRGMRPWTHS
jgi:hypothetical protein